eukprot:348439-Amphidinium_carterae.1
MDRTKRTDKNGTNIEKGTLWDTFPSLGRFKLGEMEDATETIEVLLDVLHASSLTSEPIGRSGSFLLLHPWLPVAPNPATSVGEQKPKCQKAT